MQGLVIDIQGGGCKAERGLDHLTHYYRPFTQPLKSFSALSDSEVDAALADIGTYEPLPYRLSHPEYIRERRRIEATMWSRFKEKGGRPELEHPHYFILGEFSLWESDDSLRADRIRLSSSILHKLHSHR